VSHVHAITAGATASVKVERLALLMTVQDLGQFAVAEHNASAHETVWPVAGDLLETLKDIRGERTSTELAREFLIVDWQELARLVDTTGDIEGGDDLSGSLRRWGFFAET